MNKILLAVLLCAMSVPAMAVQTSHWTHTNEADFKKGRFQNTVATNLGDVKLSRAVKTLMEQDPRITMVSALAQGPDGTIYAGTGPHGIILQLKDEKISTFATLEDQIVYSLLIDSQGRVLAGTGGERGRILRIAKAGDKPEEIFSADGVQYVWAMQQTPDGNIYAGTGANGQVYEIKPDGTKSVLFECDENNMLSMASDGKDILYVGTDPNGLVYRIDRKTKQAFVIFDAPEGEVAALALDAKGNLYAGTALASDGDDATPDEPGASEKTGRPESTDNSTPLPSPTPKEPSPPVLPKPDPNEPAPIPKNPNLVMLDMAWEKAVRNPDEGGDDNPGAAPSAPAMPGTPSDRPTSAPNARVRPGARPAPNQQPGAPTVPGNAIYRIDTNGFVTEVFREPAMILSMVEKDGVLLVGTGSDGLVYQVNPAAEETVVLAKVDPKQVMSMLPTKDGRVILGMANVGGIAAMSSGSAEQGTYTSPILDAQQISRFGKIHLQGSLPEGATLTVATRSGNLAEPRSTGWSTWSAEIPAAEFVQIPSPPARYFQYRLTYTSKNGVATPVVDEVDVAYLQPNLAPQVKSVRIAPAGDGEARPGMPNQPPMAPGARGPAAASGRMRQIAWEASDPNGDAMEYSLYYRTAPHGQWILLQDKLKEPQYTWDTRGVSDGRYHIKVVASDVRANPRGEGKTGSRISDPVVVDNTPPVIGDLKVTPFGGRNVKIEATIADRTSIVASAEYSIDSKDDWQAVAASDNLFDSPEEAVAFTVEDLPPGPHQIVVRAGDSYGNQAYQTITVTIAGADRK